VPCRKKSCKLFGSVEVPYKGNTHADVIFVGESPGRQEVKKGVPFYEFAPAGKEIRKVAAIAGLDWDSLFLMNAARCMIDKKSLSGKEITLILASCREKVISAIELITPKVIVALGDFALRQLLRKSGITKARGKFVWSKEFHCWVFPTYHPAYICRNMALEEVLLRDLQQVKKFCDNGYKLVEYSDEHEFIQLCEVKKEFEGYAKVAIDTETQGLDWLSKDFLVVSYSVGVSENKGFQVRLYREGTEEDHDFTIEKNGKEVFVKRSEFFDSKIDALKKLLLSTSKKYMMNGNFDCHAFDALFKRERNECINVNNYVMDLQVAAHLLEENVFKMASLDELQAAFTDMPTGYKQSFEEEYGYENVLGIPDNPLSDYACKDAIVTYKIGMVLAEKLKAEPKLLRYFVNLAMPVVKNTLYELEKNGVTIDSEGIPKALESVKKRMDDFEKAAFKSAPVEFRKKHIQGKGLKLTRRDEVVSVLLFTKEGFNLNPRKTTKSGNPSIDSESRDLLLEGRISAKARLFLKSYGEWSDLHTLYTRYLKGFEKHIKSDGRVHSRYSITSAVTGRTACVPMDAEMLTIHGWKKWNQLKIGELAIGYNVQTGRIVLTELKDLHFGKEAIGTLYYRHGKMRRIGVNCTKNHKWIVGTDLIKGFVTAEDAEKTRGGGYHLILSSGIPADFGTYISTDDDYVGAALVGWALTDGDINRTSSGRYYLEVKLKKQRSVRKFREQMQGRSYSISLYSNGATRFGVGVEVFDRIWTRVMRAGSIVSYIVSLSPKARREMWDAMIEADGTIRRYGGGKSCYPGFKERENYAFGNKVELSPYKPNVGEAFSALSVLMGKALKYKYREIKGKKPFVDWEISEMRNKYPKYVYGTEPEDVWCPETSTGTWIVKQNGVVGITGNSSSPNMQNNPKRSRSAEIIRRLIIAPKGYVLLAVDASQAELRWIAHTSGDKEMIRVFLSDEDIHTNTAKGLVSKLWDSLDSKEREKARRNAKAGNFGLIYGMMVHGFVNYAKSEYGIDLSIEKAEEWIRSFFRLYPGIRRYHKRAIDFCRRRGYVESQLGRRRRLPEINSTDSYLVSRAEKQAVNHPIQSPSSDVTLLAGSELKRKNLIDPAEILMVLFVHDELIFEVVDDSNVIKKYVKIIKYEMEHPPLRKYFGFDFKVPFKADVKVGGNLAEMKVFEM